MGEGESLRPRPLKVGVHLDALGEKRKRTIAYSILQLNTRQRAFEFEILPRSFFSDEYNSYFGSRTRVERSECKDRAKAARLPLVAPQIFKRGTGVIKDCCEHHIAFSLMSFSDNYYATDADKDLTLVALGNWDRHMAPPSLLEFIVMYCLRDATMVAVNSKSLHFNARGCLFDFNTLLSNARYHVLTGHVCRNCLDEIRASDPMLADELPKVTGGRWLGNKDDRTAAVNVLPRLGFHPFITKEIVPTWWEKLREALPNKVADWAVPILLTAVLAALGFRAVGM